MTSDGFSEMYGYSLEESLNRNCVCANARSLDKQLAKELPDSALYRVLEPPNLPWLAYGQHVV